jgi:argininosuccinate lyase
MTTDPLWKGRISGAPDPAFFSFQRSLPYDARLLPQDLQVNAAWARALGRAGLLAREEVDRLETELAAIGRALSPLAAARRDEEDVHTLVEVELTARAGELGRRIHRGKSRNDQVATDLRLWTAEASRTLALDARALCAALADRAGEWLADGAVVPGYTHLQQAEPVLAAHWALAHVEAFRRDARRFTQVREAALAACPLGSAALSGTPLKIDRAELARELGFAAPSANSIDAVSDRDFAAEFLHAAHLFLLHGSRLAEDLVLWSTREFAFVRLPDAFTTGSSAMPQKRNPDAMELARAKAARALGRYTALGATLKALPSGYNKDLQEDKEGVFDAFDTARAVGAALAGPVAGMELDAARARLARLDPRGRARRAARALDWRSVTPTRWSRARGRARRGRNAGSRADRRRLVEARAEFTPVVADLSLESPSPGAAGGTAPRASPRRSKACAPGGRAHERRHGTGYEDAITRKINAAEARAREAEAALERERAQTEGLVKDNATLRLRVTELEKKTEGAVRGALIAWTLFGLALLAAVILAIVWTGAITRFISS